MPASSLEDAIFNLDQSFMTATHYGSDAQDVDAASIRMVLDELGERGRANAELRGALDRALTAINAGFGKAQRDHIIAEGRKLLET